MDIEDLTAKDISLPDEFDGLPTFIVGGWVRDSLLDGERPSDVDLMVAEVSPEEMESRGFRRIDSANNDTFGVFQDSLGREVALARQEQSTGPGHRDFDVTPVPEDVPASEAVERDLSRRDFTINAMALDARFDVLHDPHDGRADLEAGAIRHVSDSSFKEDPLRILRGARFAARLDFDVAGETKDSMREAASGLRDLPPERHRMELEKALVEADEPSQFFKLLRNVRALECTFPEIAALDLVPAGPVEHHQEGSTFEHTMLVLDKMVALRPRDELAALMALFHDVGKGSTPTEFLPSHRGHGRRGIDLIDQMADRDGFSKEQERAMKEASRQHMRLQEPGALRLATVLHIHDESRFPSRLVDLMSADADGRRPKGEFPRDLLVERFTAAAKARRAISGQDLIDEGHDPDEMGGENFGDLLHQRRVEKMRELVGDD